MLVDSHCHISLETQVDVSQLDSFYGQNGVEKVCLMSTSHVDYKVVDQLAQNSSTIIPSFGIHPWFAHLFTFEKNVSKQSHYQKVFNVQTIDDELYSNLLDPIDIDEHLTTLETLIHKHSFDKDTKSTPVVVGEVGLDKLFRIPLNGYFVDRTTRLTKYKTIMDHQVKVFKAQAKFAFERNLPLSIHNVKCMGVLIDVVKELYKDSHSNLMLHSYTGSIDSLKLLIKIVGIEHIFVSTSWYLNGEDGRYTELLHLVPPSNLLIESDISINNYEDQLELLKKVDGLISTANVDNLNRYLLRE